MMPGLTNSEYRYGWVAMALHWSIVVLVALSVWYAYSRGFIPRDQRDVRRAIMMIHFDWSWVLTGLALARILWRLLTPRPREINQERRLVLAHKLVVGLLAWLPILITLPGIVNVWSGGRDVKAFGITLIAGMSAKNESLHDIAEIVHVGLWYLFAAALVLHVGAALWHHFVKKDETLRRMLPWGKVG